MSTCQLPGRACREIQIVLIDDEPAFRTSLAELLALDGHEVATFASAREVPPLGTIEHVGVLITEYELPDADGFSLADDFEARDPTLPVIVLTARRDRRVEALAAAREFVSLVEKPMRYETLHEHIHQRTCP